LHLACGATRLPGWLNIDGNLFRRPDMWLDLRNRFPFGANTIAGIVACHFLEHLYEEELGHFLSECHRVLKPGGFIRLSVPDLDKYIQDYTKAGCTADAARQLDRQLFLGGGHKRTFNSLLLAQVVHAAGFVEVEQKDPTQSEFLTEQEIASAEQWPETTVSVEARKGYP